MANSRKARGAEPAADALSDIVEPRLRAWGVRGERVSVGLSGGIDSIVLLDVLRRLSAKLPFELSALHVHHGLSPNADAWERFCRRHCARRGIAFRAVRVQVAGEGANLEDEARRVRYRAFVESGSPIIALAHNRDDQAETVLLRLFRGAGVRGLAGIPEMRMLKAHDGIGADGGQIIVRPLLGTSRSEIEGHARRRRLSWIEDESNADVRYARNFVRRQVLPLAEARFPGCRATLARAASHLAEADALLRALAEEDLARASIGGAIDAAALQALGGARAANALRLALESRGEPPVSAETTREILRQLASARVDAQPSFALSRVAVRRYRGCLVIEPHCRAPVDVAATWQRLDWNGRGRQNLPDGTSVTVAHVVGQGISRARLEAGVVTLRRRLGGERVRLHPRGATRTLKNLLQERSVPPWQRRAMPLLYCGEQLVWIPAVGVAFEFQATPGEAGLEFDWQPRET